MLPFLAANLESMFKTLMKMFVRREILDEAVTGYKLVKIDLTNSSNIVPSELINLPTATKNLLKSNILSEDKKRQFKKDSITILVAIVRKLQERSPLKYLVVRCASCIAPLNMVRNKDECSVKFTKLIDKLYSCKWISSSVGDEAKKEYVFLDTAQHEHKDAFLSFSFKKDQIDKFLLSYLHENLWKICIIIMTLSHGQSAVERGFSVNKELLVENLKKVSIVNQRIVYDHFIASEVKLNEFPVSNVVKIL